MDGKERKKARWSWIFAAFVFLVQCYVSADLEAEKFDVQQAMQNYDPMYSRLTPPKLAKQVSGNQGYIITAQRLQEIRRDLLYPFYDQDYEGRRGDLVTELNDNSAQVHKQLNFLLPYFGFGFNYTWLSLHGFMSFSDSMSSLPLPPLHFPVQTWPKDNDPSFISPFYSRCRIGRYKESDADKRSPGVYFRLERDLPARTDQMGVEMRERLKWDVRESIVGSESFIPKHVAIATWKNVSFVGGFNAAEIVNHLLIYQTREYHIDS